MTQSHHIAVRVDSETLARIDAQIPALSSPWHTAKRSDALRMLILAGLDAIEARSARPARTPRK